MIVRVRGRRVPIFLAAALLMAAPIVSALNSQPANAAQITLRSLTLQTGSDGPDTDTLPDGGSQPGGTANHLLTFTVPTTGTNIGSIEFLYCTTASGSDGDISESSCTAPTGLDASGFSLGAEGANATGFSKDGGSTTTNKAVISKASPATPTGGALSYRLDDVVNPTAANETFFVRIKTYSDNATTTLVDTGTVAASTATQIELTGTMPESLIFCAGATIAENAGIPDCSVATTGAVVFDKLFSPTDTAQATSQMAASTNATNGYAITVSGGTLSSGGNSIPAMTSATTSIQSTGQFGMNLVLNDEFCGVGCDLGAAVTPASNVGTDLLANPATGYDTDGTFKFDPGTSDVVARSDFGGSLGATNGQIFTASYIVNVPGSQPAGTYTSTLTYVCTPTF